MQHKGAASRKPVSNLTFPEADFDGQPTISTINLVTTRSAILRHISKDLQGIDDDEAHGSFPDRTPKGISIMFETQLTASAAHGHSTSVLLTR
jgi:hypothetical protein